MNTDRGNKKTKADAQRVLTNYKVQLGEMVKREKREIEQIKKDGDFCGEDMMSMKKLMVRRIEEFERSKQPDPRDLEDLIKDLNYEAKVKVLDAKSKRDLKQIFNMRQ